MSEFEQSERALLRLEERLPRASGAKEREIRTVLRLTPTRYYQRLRALVRDERAVAEFPQVCAGCRASRSRRCDTGSRAASERRWP